MTSLVLILINIYQREFKFYFKTIMRSTHCSTVESSWIDAELVVLALRNNARDVARVRQRTLAVERTVTFTADRFDPRGPVQQSAPSSPSSSLSTSGALGFGSAPSSAALPPYRSLQQEIGLKLFFRLLRRFEQRMAGRVFLKMVRRVPTFLDELPRLALAGGRGEDVEVVDAVSDMLELIVLGRPKPSSSSSAASLASQASRSSTAPVVCSPQDKGAALVALVGLAVKRASLRHLIRVVELLVEEERADALMAAPAQLELCANAIGNHADRAARQKAAGTAAPLERYLDELAAVPLDAALNAIARLQSAAAGRAIVVDGNHARTADRVVLRLPSQAVGGGGSAPPLRRVAAFLDDAIAVTESGELHAWVLAREAAAAPSSDGGGSRSSASFVATLAAGARSLAGWVVVIDVACGVSHALALSSSGQVYGWGSNENGRLGIGSDDLGGAALGSTPQQRAHAIVFPRVREEGGGVGSGGSHGSSSSSPSASAERTTRTIVAIAAGAAHSAAISSDGGLFSWGCGAGGQCGRLTDVHAPMELEVDDVTVAEGRTPAFAQLACGWQHSVALTVTGRLYAWGSGCTARRASPAVLGCVAASGAQPTPRRVNSASFGAGKVVHVACGWDHTVACVVEGDGAEARGRVFSWGCGFGGRLGLGSHDDVVMPRLVTGGGLGEHDVTFVAAGATRSIAVTRSGAVFYWGCARSVAVGLPSASAASTETSIRGGGAAADGKNFARDCRLVPTKLSLPKSAGRAFFGAVSGDHFVVLAHEAKGTFKSKSKPNPKLRSIASPSSSVSATAVAAAAAVPTSALPSPSSFSGFTLSSMLRKSPTFTFKPIACLDLICPAHGPSRQSSVYPAMAILGHLARLASVSLAERFVAASPVFFDSSSTSGEQSSSSDDIPSTAASTATAPTTTATVTATATATATSASTNWRPYYIDSAWETLLHLAELLRANVLPAVSGSPASKRSLPDTSWFVGMCCLRILKANLAELLAAKAKADAVLGSSSGNAPPFHVAQSGSVRTVCNVVMALVCRAASSSSLLDDICNMGQESSTRWTSQMVLQIEAIDTLRTGFDLFFPTPAARWELLGELIERRAAPSAGLAGGGEQLSGAGSSSLPPQANTALLEILMNRLSLAPTLDRILAHSFTKQTCGDGAASAEATNLIEPAALFHALSDWCLTGTSATEERSSSASVSDAPTRLLLTMQQHLVGVWDRADIFELKRLGGLSARQAVSRRNGRDSVRLSLAIESCVLAHSMHVLALCLTFLDEGSANRTDSAAWPVMRTLTSELAVELTKSRGSIHVAIVLIPILLEAVAKLAGEARLQTLLATLAAKLAGFLVEGPPPQAKLGDGSDVHASAAAENDVAAESGDEAEVPLAHHFNVLTAWLEAQRSGKRPSLSSEQHAWERMAAVRNSAAVASARTAGFCVWQQLLLSVGGCVVARVAVLNSISATEVTWTLHDELFQGMERCAPSAKRTLLRAFTLLHCDLAVLLRDSAVGKPGSGAASEESIAVLRAWAVHLRSRDSDDTATPVIPYEKPSPTLPPTTFSGGALGATKVAEATTLGGGATTTTTALTPLNLNLKKTKSSRRERVVDWNQIFGQAAIVEALDQLFEFGIWAQTGAIAASKWALCRTAWSLLHDITLDMSLHFAPLQPAAAGAEAIAMETRAEVMALASDFLLNELVRVQHALVAEVAASKSVQAQLNSPARQSRGGGIGVTYPDGLWRGCTFGAALHITDLAIGASTSAAAASRFAAACDAAAREGCVASSETMPHGLAVAFWLWVDGEESSMDPMLPKSEAVCVRKALPDSAKAAWAPAIFAERDSSPGGATGIRIRCIAGSASAVSPTPLRCDRWTHICVVLHPKEGGWSLHLVIDGTLEAQGAMSVSDSFDTSEPFFFGSACEVCDPQLIGMRAGRIADTVVFARALAPEEVKALASVALSPVRMYLHAHAYQVANLALVLARDDADWAKATSTPRWVTLLLRVLSLAPLAVQRCISRHLQLVLPRLMPSNLLAPPIPSLELNSGGDVGAGGGSRRQSRSPSRRAAAGSGLNAVVSGRKGAAGVLNFLAALLYSASYTVTFDRTTGKATRGGASLISDDMHGLVAEVADLLLHLLTARSWIEGVAGHIRYVVENFGKAFALAKSSAANQLSPPRSPDGAPSEPLSPRNELPPDTVRALITSVIAAAHGLPQRLRIGSTIVIADGTAMRSKKELREATVVMVEASSGDVLVAPHSNASNDFLARDEQTDACVWIAASEARLVDSDGSRFAFERREQQSEDGESRSGEREPLDSLFLAFAPFVNQNNCDDEDAAEPAPWAHLKMQVTRSLSVLLHQPMATRAFAESGLLSGLLDIALGDASAIFSDTSVLPTSVREWLTGELAGSSQQVNMFNSFPYSYDFTRRFYRINIFQ